ncbi:Oidioi.mRNA.OKI2018_I69.chr2.g5475.t1.cds [Oikopleura dioica]|uniref:Oidioi.mRNA.OKI2018_I69.chr2.g5475.t1.cds n=1 Tax=Oikopleura dioica TaxID=34765 RepID=A0ABN7T4U2_OIKDI|nr:Oidioi.mRNA.OKI2018_I69.chr2.g5475.t1.cds [Oikopleura dioica]
MAGVWFGVSDASYACIAIVLAELLVILCLSLYLFYPTKDGSGIPEIAGCDVADPEFKRGRVSESKSLLNSDSSSLANFLPVPKSAKIQAKPSEPTYVRQNSLHPLPEPIVNDSSPVDEPIPSKNEPEKPKTPIFLEPKVEVPVEKSSGVDEERKRRKSVDFLISEKTGSEDLSVIKEDIKEEITREETTHREVTPISPTMEKIKTEREIITTTKTVKTFSNLTVPETEQPDVSTASTAEVRTDPAHVDSMTNEAMSNIQEPGLSTVASISISDMTISSSSNMSSSIDISATVLSIDSPEETTSSGSEFEKEELKISEIKNEKQ